MKIKHFASYSVFTASALCLCLVSSSCSLFKNTGTASSSNSNAIKKDIVLPHDREAVRASIDPKAYTPEEFKEGVVKGDWAIETVFGEKAIGEKSPFIKFSESDGKIYGNNGCNVINGSYEYSAKTGSLTFSNIAVTMMLCNMEGITDIQINNALNDTRTYELTENESGYIMTLFNRAKEPVMTMSLQNLDFLNGTWSVTKIDDKEVDIDGMRLVFDIDEHKIHGNTGCNVFNGSMVTDMDTPNTFSFEGIAVTMMMCPYMEYQTALLVALEDACRAKPIDKETVVLLNPMGEPVLTLERAADK